MEPKPKQFSRRDFLNFVGLSGVAAVLGSCASPPAPPPPTNTPPLPSGMDMRTATAPAIATDIPRINLITDPQFLAELESRGITNHAFLDAQVAQELGEERLAELVQPAWVALQKNPRFPATELNIKASLPTGEPQIYFTAFDRKLYIPNAEGKLIETAEDQNGALATPTLEPAPAYPADTSGFILGAGGETTTEADVRGLDEFGFMDTEVERLKGWWEGKLPQGAQLNWAINTEAQTWVGIPQTREGQFIIPLLTKGSDAGQLVRALMPDGAMAQAGEDFFEGVVVSYPENLKGKGQQQLIATRSGWFVIGFMNPDGKLYAWFDAEHDKWVFTDEGLKAAATATPKPEPTKTPTQQPAPTQEQLSTATQPPQPTATSAAPTTPEQPAAGCERTERGRKEGYYRVQQLDGSVIERRWLDYYSLGRIGYIGDLPFVTDPRIEFTFEIFGKIVAGPSGGTVTVDMGSFGQKVVRVDNAIMSMGAAYKVAGVYGGEVCQHNSTYYQLLKPDDVAKFYINPSGPVDQANPQPSIDALMLSGELIAVSVSFQQ